MENSKIFGQNILWVGIDSECYKTYLKTVIKIQKDPNEFYIWELYIFAENGDKW